MQNRGGKYKFEGLHPLKKFGQFAETEDVDASDEAEIRNAVVEEEHDVQVVGSDEDVYVVHPPEYEDVVTGNEHDLDFDFEMVTIPFEVKLQSRVFELEQDSLSHTLLIQELKIENEAKDRKIKELETNMGYLSAIVLDMKQNLQKKFKGEFLDESSSSTAVEPEPEMSRAEFDELNRSREEGLRKYFAGDRSGIVCWGYDEVKELWWLRRKLTKRIEYYDHPSSFKLLIVVDMVELSRQRLFNPTKNKRRESFYTSLQQHVRKGFSDMTLAKFVTLKKTTNSLGNPIDIDVFEVRWPAIDWMKKVSILPDLPEGVVDNFKFWAFDKQTYGVIINCGEVDHAFYDPIDLMCLSEKDIKSLNNHIMKVDQDNLEDALEFVV
ncbi:hypothetical protein R6Q57_019538 [Mikania cordata]